MNTIDTVIIINTIYFIIHKPDDNFDWSFNLTSLILVCGWKL